ncbi:MAG: BrnT family toxin [Deltaproteobacteria bacterium]|nr:BrnT family toxin [Deltaproteobacteria bacterium]
MPPLPQFRVSVFDDIFDRLFVEDSSDEVRFILVGLSLHSGVLVVVNCHRDEDSVIRIISARKATNREGNFYLLDCVKHNRKISLEWVA